MTKYDDFEMVIKKGTDSDNERKLSTTMDCFELSKFSVEMSIKYCKPTQASGCTGCCNSKKNCPASTGRR